MAILAIFAVALYLRFDGLAEPSLWLDEILHFEKTRKAADEPWYTWLTGMSVDRENGPLYYASQLLALRLFDGEFAVRLMPALAGLATVLVVFFAGLSATGSRPAATATAALLAVSPLHVYYSREGRPYAAVMLAAALLLLLALEHRRGWAKVAVYALSIATAYLGAVAFPVLLSGAALATLEWLRRRRCGHVALATLAGLGVGALLFSTVTREGRTLGSGEHDAKWDITSPVSVEALDRLLASLSVSGGDWGSSNGLSFLFLALALWGGIRLARTEPRAAFWGAGLCLLPIAGWLTALAAFGHWYNVRYTSVGLPAFLVLVGVAVADLCRLLWQPIGRRFLGKRHNWAADALLAAFLVALLLPAWRTARAEPRNKPDWRGIAEMIGRLAAPEEPVIARDPWGETCIRHYLRRLRHEVEVLPVHFDVARATRLTERHARGWVLAAGYRRTDEFQAWMRTLDPVLKTRLANLELFFFPDFPSFLSEPARIEGLASIVALEPESAARQEFTHSELLLGAGWSYPERSPDGTSYRWATADRAEMALLAPPSGQKGALRLRLLPFPTSERPAQSVGIAINSRPLTRVTLQPGWNEISLPPAAGSPAAGSPAAGSPAAGSPADVPPAGDGPPPSDGHAAADLITFDFAWRQSPRELDPGSPDARQLAVAFDFVEAIHTPPGPPASAE